MTHGPGWDVPIDLPREEARRLAEVELADPAYHAAEPSLIERAVQWVLDRIEEALDRAAGIAPGGWLGLLGLLVLIGLALAVIRWRVGPISRSAALTLTVDPQVSADQYRERASALAADEQWAEAIVERMRAVARGAAETGLMAQTVGLTADEVTEAVAAQIPDAAATMATAARAFDEVRYGGRPGTQQRYEAVVAADQALSSALAPR